MDGGGVHGRRGEDPRQARRSAARARRRAVRRRRAVALAVLASAVAIGLAAFGGGSSPPSRPRGATGATAAAGVTGQSAATGPAAGGAARTSSAHTSDTASGAAHTRAAAPSPGSLPQTHAYPSGTSAQFRALMASLWAGVVHDSVARALPAFFPEKAYVQLKAIAAAGSDWSDRLVYDYGLDVTAAHRLLGRDAGRARLLAANVVSSYGHWIAPGICYNSIGYYEMPNARIVYREDGQVRSFGIASMISWRGVWYVVHFGAILRASDTGMVDAPAGGPGASAYSGTC